MIFFHKLSIICSQIPQATTTTNAAKSANDYAGVNRLCGRFFDVDVASADSDTVCSKYCKF